MELMNLEKGLQHFAVNPPENDPEDFQLDPEYVIANYDNHRVQSIHWRLKVGPRFWFSPKSFKYNILGQTWKPISSFLSLYFGFLILFYYLPTPPECNKMQNTTTTTAPPSDPHHVSTYIGWTIKLYRWGPNKKLFL
jgi:hypothetical protein